MKSAYEKAMERMEKRFGPTQSLSDEQRAAIAEIEKKYDAEIARVTLDLETRIAQAASPNEAEAAAAELRAERQRLDEKRAAEKDAIWQQHG